MRLLLLSALASAILAPSARAQSHPRVPSSDAAPSTSIADLAGPGPYRLVIDSATDRFTGIDARTIATPLLPTSDPEIGVLARVKDCRTSPPDANVSADPSCDRISISFAGVRPDSGSAPQARMGLGNLACLDLLVTGENGRILQRTPDSLCLGAVEDSLLEISGAEVLIRKVDEAPDSLWINLAHARSVEFRGSAREFSLPTASLETLQEFWAEADPRPDVAPALLNRTTVAAALHRLYPHSLRDAGISGTVVLDFVVAVDGTVDPNSYEIINAANPELVRIAMQVMTEAQFSPGLDEGHPVRTVIRMPLNFR